MIVDDNDDVILDMKYKWAKVSPKAGAISVRVEAVE